MTNTDAIAPNAKRLLAAGFTAILAAGLGFGIRGGIFANWAADFGFTGAIVRLHSLPCCWLPAAV